MLHLIPPLLPRHISLQSTALLSDRANDGVLTFIDPSPQVTGSPLLLLFFDTFSSQKPTRQRGTAFMRAVHPADCLYEA